MRKRSICALLLAAITAPWCARAASASCRAIENALPAQAAVYFQGNGARLEDECFMGIYAFLRRNKCTFTRRQTVASGSFLRPCFPLLEANKTPIEVLKRDECAKR